MILSLVKYICDDILLICLSTSLYQPDRVLTDCDSVLQQPLNKQSGSVTHYRTGTVLHWHELNTLVHHKQIAIFRKSISFTCNSDRKIWTRRWKISVLVSSHHGPVCFPEPEYHYCAQVFADHHHNIKGKPRYYRSFLFIYCSRFGTNKTFI